MRVMVIGASSNRTKFGNRAVRAYMRQGHDVLPVNPYEEQIEGLRTYARPADVPGVVDRVTLYVPPEIGIGVVRELAERGSVGELWVNPGAGSPELLAEAARLGLEVVQGCAILDIGERP